MEANPDLQLQTKAKESVPDRIYRGLGKPGTSTNPNRIMKLIRSAISLAFGHKSTGHAAPYQPISSIQLASLLPAQLYTVGKRAFGDALPAL